MADTGFIKVAQVCEIRPGDMIAVDVANEQVLLVNLDGNIHAVHDICSHPYASLSSVALMGSQLECSLHGGALNPFPGTPTHPTAN